MLFLYRQLWWKFKYQDSLIVLKIVCFLFEVTIRFATWPSFILFWIFPFRQTYVISSCVRKENAVSIDANNFIYLPWIHLVHFKRFHRIHRSVIVAMCFVNLLLTVMYRWAHWPFTSTIYKWNYVACHPSQWNTRFYYMDGRRNFVSGCM